MSCLIEWLRIPKKVWAGPQTFDEGGAYKGGFKGGLSGHPLKGVLRGGKGGGTKGRRA